MRGVQPKTVWRITRIGELRQLDIVLSVDTTAPLVTAAIEKAAKDAGINMQRGKEGEGR